MILTYIVFAAHPWPISLIFDLVKREEWGAISLPTGKPLIHSNVMYILLYHTGSQDCNNFSECEILLKEMQVCREGELIFFLCYAC